MVHDRALTFLSLAVTMLGATACTSSTQGPGPLDAGMEAQPQSLPDVDVDGPLTVEGCQPGQACQCVGASAVCMGDTQKSCTQPMECNDSPTSAVFLCVSPGGDAGGVCARACAIDGGCGGKLCPSGYVCEQPPIGRPSYRICILPGALQALDCTTDQSCQQYIPGGSCTADGCVLACGF